MDQHRNFYNINKNQPILFHRLQQRVLRSLLVLDGFSNQRSQKRLQRHCNRQQCLSAARRRRGTTKRSSNADRAWPNGSTAKKGCPHGSSTTRRPILCLLNSTRRMILISEGIKSTTTSLLLDLWKIQFPYQAYQERRHSVRHLYEPTSVLGRLWNRSETC